MREINSLQLQGELQSKKDAPRLYRGVFHGASVILKNEGPKGLYRGIGAAVMLCVHCIFGPRLIVPTVCVPDDPQWLPPWLLRAPPQKPHFRHL